MDLATRTIEELAGWATLTVLVIINVMTSQWDQTDPVSDELIMKGTSVLMDFN